VATHAKKAIPGKKKGGARAGAGREPVYVEACKTYTALEDIRTAGKMTEEQAALLREARETMLEIMRRPSRYAQQRIIAAKHFIEEIAGKVPDQMQVDQRTTVVEVVKSDKPLPQMPLIRSAPDPFRAEEVGDVHED